MHKEDTAECKIVEEHIGVNLLRGLCADIRELGNCTGRAAR